jgi:predicted DNA-binding transcriptional regulator YafY
MRADRLLAILMLLQTRQRVTAGELAAALEVSERTIYRDITALDAAGVPIYTESGPGGGIGLVESYRTDLTGLNTNEVQALSMISIPQPLLQLGVGRELEAALRKLSASIPHGTRETEARTRQRIYLDSSWWFQTEELAPQFDVIQQAVWQDRLLDIAFRGDFSAEIALTVAPLGLVAKANVWYLVFAHAEHYRVVRAAHIHEAKLLDETFVRPPEFDLPAFWQAWCAEYESNQPHYTVIARLSPSLLQALPFVFGDKAADILVNASPPDTDGWRTATLTFESFEAARTRLLGLGNSVEVVSPLPLRLSLIDFAQQIIEFYKPE